MFISKCQDQNGYQMYVLVDEPAPSKKKIWSPYQEFTEFDKLCNNCNDLEFGLDSQKQLILIDSI